MKKNIIIIICMLLLCLNLFSQQDETKTSEQAIINNWYIEAGGGIQMLFSTDADQLKFEQRITPAITLTGGKWFSPYWGTRIQFSGYSLNGNSTTEGQYIANLLPNGEYGNDDPVRNEVVIRPDGSYRHYVRYVNAHLDFQFSAVNLLVGYDINRKWDIIPAIGVGYLRTFEYKGTPVTDNFLAHASILGKFSLYRNFDINLELSTMFLPDKFDGRLTDRFCENNLALTLGISYNFRKAKDYKPLKNITDIGKGKSGKKAKKQKYYYSDEQDVAKVVVKDTLIIERVVEKVIEKDTKKDTEFTPFVLSSILFNFGESVPMKDQKLLLINVSKYMSDNPKAKIRLDGYGDKDTGTPEENLKISTKRAESIKEILVKEYGINANRISVKGIGADYQPYTTNDWNRVVVVNVVE